MCETYTHFIFFNKLFIDLWLCRVFIAAQAFSIVAASGDYSGCGAQASHCVASLVSEHGLWVSRLR